MSSCNYQWFLDARRRRRERGNEGTRESTWGNVYKEIGDLLHEMVVRFWCGDFLDRSRALLREMRELFCINVISCVAVVHT